MPTGDEDLDKRRRKMIEEKIQMMRRNQERRLQRKNQQLISAGGEPMQMKGTTKPDTTRKCGHCGQIGHMKTNRKCPLWAQFNGPNAQGSPATATASTPNSTMAGTASASGFVSGLPSTLDANVGILPTPTPQQSQSSQHLSQTQPSEMAAPSPNQPPSNPGTPSAPPTQPKIKLNLGKKPE